MSIVDILYIILGACVVVITVTIVWFANEAMKLIKSLRKSSDDVAFMTEEVKGKVLMVSEALDRAGTAATNIISLVEDAVEGIKEKRDQLSNSIGLVAGVGDYFKKKNHGQSEKKVEPAKEDKKEEKEEKVEPKIDEEEKKFEEALESEAKSEKEPVKLAKEEAKAEESSQDNKKEKDNDLESAKPIKKEVLEKPKSK